MPRSAVVIDDNPRSRAHTETVLASHRLEIIESSPHNLNAPRVAVEQKPDIVFVAVEEPMMRCLQTLTLLAGRLESTPIVAYSTSSATSVFQQAVRAGATLMLDAPLNGDQVAQALSRLLGTPSSVPKASMGRIITVVGQKGGIGKTTISANLAAALASEAHSSVLIIDFDTTFGDVGLTMDVDSRITAAEMATDLGDFDREAFKASLIPHDSGAFVLPAPAHVGEWLSVSPEKLAHLVDFAAHMFDYVIVDTPGAFNDAVAAALELADHSMIVTSMEITSVKNTSLLLEVLSAAGYPDERTLVMVNHTIEDPGVTVVDVAPTLNRASVWEVPYDPAVRSGSQAGRPVVLLDPKSLGGKSLRALAHRIATEPERIDRRAAVRAPKERKGDNAIGSRLRDAMKRLAS
jgi:pilus assembly protein CpaE